MPPSVLEVLADRRTTSSRPGQRADAHRVALAIEGGGNRAAYSAGMCLAIDELGLVDCFDAVYGTSGGALNAAWLLTGEAQQWLPSWADPEVAAAGVTDPRRLLRGGPLVDLSRLVDHVYEQITPMDFGAILANPVSYHPIATSAGTGDAVDLAPTITDRASLKRAIRASSCMPLLAGRPVRIEGETYVDGGVAEGVPWPSAVAGGATHVLVLRTRREGQTVTDSRLERAVLTPYFLRHARGAGRSHARRPASYQATDATTTEGAELLQLRPPAGSHDVGRLTKDLGSIEAALELGRQVARDVLG